MLKNRLALFVMINSTIVVLLVILAVVILGSIEPGFVWKSAPYGVF